MKILHILKNEPDDTVQRLIDAMSDEEDESSVEPLFKKDIHWERVVDDIFSHDKIICWW